MGSQANDLAKEIEMNRKLRTAIAALVAALSVAVMIDSAPAKTSIGSISSGGSDVTPWTVTHKGSGGTYRQLLNGPIAYRTPGIKGTCPKCGG
jgi:hypothetical protein